MRNLFHYEIPRLRYPITLEEFYRSYYISRKPVIISTNALSELGWRTHLWTSEYLLYKAGNQQVQVLTRSDKSNYALDRINYVSMPFHKFVNCVMANKTGDSDIYLNLQHDRALDPPLLQLVGDFNIPVYFKDLVMRSINMWMGNSATSITTPLHHDFNDNLYVLVEGRKDFILFPPEQAVNLYPRGELLGVEANGVIRYRSLEDGPHMSQLDPTRPDTGHFPLYAEAAEARCECHLEKNEMLFLPTGWFHQVTSFGRHIAVSFFSVPPSVEQLGRLREAMITRDTQRNLPQS